MAKLPHWLPVIVSTDHALRIRRVGLDLDEVTSLITLAIAEDLDGGVDITTVSTVPLEQRSTLNLTARKAGVVSGAVVAAAVIDLVSQHTADIEIVIPDGMEVAAGDVDGCLQRGRFAQKREQFLFAVGDADSIRVAFRAACVFQVGPAHSHSLYVAAGDSRMPIKVCRNAAAATPTRRLAVEMIPSLAPRTAARSHPMRATRWLSGCACRRLIGRPVAGEAWRYQASVRRDAS